MCFSTVGIPMGTNCSLLLTDLFLYSYEADFIHSQEKRKEASPIFFNFTFRYIDDVLSLNNASFGDFVDRIYPIELEIKDTTEILFLLVKLKSSLRKFYGRHHNRYGISVSQMTTDMFHLS